MNRDSGVRVWSWGTTRMDEGRVRITYIVNSLGNGGAERRTLELLRHINRERFTPSLILMEEAGLEYAREWAPQCFVMGIPQGGNSRWLNRSPALMRAIWKTQAQLAAWRTHIVHAMLPAPSILGGIAARMAGVPIVIGSRPCLTNVYRTRQRIVTLADKATLRLAHLNISNSLAARQDLITAGGCPSDKCRTIYNGVDTRRFHPDLPQSWRANMGWNGENVVLGLVGNFRSCKRHSDFVRAASLILQKHPESRFFMMGADYGTRDTIRQQIQELGLHSKVSIVEADSRPEQVFAAMDVYICTSASESLSNVLLEAMSCGKPVIATRVGGNPEVIVDGATGYLVPCGSPELIAQAANKLVADPSLRQAMGRCGRRRAEQEFSLERMVHNHEELYLRLLAERRINLT